MVGMGAMRRYIARANYDPLQRMQMSTLVALTSRSVDFAAGLRSMVPAFAAPLQQRAAALAERIGEIRRSLRTHAVPPAWEPAERSAGTPLISELEAMVGLMPKVFSSATSIDPRFEILEAPPAPNRFFVEDAFTNPDHLRYVLGGTLAAMLCYVLYVSLDWPGISTAVTTCVLTGLSNIGASRQKQVLRIAGVVLGGFVFGLGAQVFVLPYIDSITGFAVLFATVTAIAAWVSTSSARLSYAGLQIAFAFFLINLTEFRIQLSLTVARNRVAGVLLGITMMWLVFERLYSKPAFDEMVRLFVSNVRLMATLVSESRIGADAETILQIRRHRDHVYRKFGEVSAQADAVPFETGPARAGHMAARDRIRNWQSTLRTFYLMEVPLVQFRLYRNPEDMSPAFRNIERRFLQDCAATLNLIADTIEEQLDGKSLRPAPGKSLQAMLDAAEAAESGALLPEEQGLLRLTRSLAALLDGLEADATTEPLLATG
jgi:multidrug resistance protein MdtO